MRKKKVCVYIIHQKAMTSQVTYCRFEMNPKFEFRSFFYRCSRGSKYGWRKIIAVIGKIFSWQNNPKSKIYLVLNHIFRFISNLSTYLSMIRRKWGKDEATFSVQRERDHRLHHRGGQRGCDEGCRISSSAGKTAAAIKNNEQWDTLPVPLWSLNDKVLSPERKKERKLFFEGEHSAQDGFKLIIQLHTSRIVCLIHSAKSSAGSSTTALQLWQK